jgi:hypothetical protein
MCLPVDGYRTCVSSMARPVEFESQFCVRAPLIYQTQNYAISRFARDSCKHTSHDPKAGHRISSPSDD